MHAIRGAAQQSSRNNEEQETKSVQRRTHYSATDNSTCCAVRQVPVKPQKGKYCRYIQAARNMNFDPFLYPIVIHDPGTC